MRPVRVGSACWKVQMTMEEAMAEGVVSLPPELAAHVAHCARCKPEVEDLQYVLSRLRSGAASITLSQVPAVVDRVIGQISAVPVVPAQTDGALAMSTAAGGSRMQAEAPPGVDLRWLLGQLGGIAAAFLLLVFGLGWLGLKVTQMATGVSPGEVMANIFTPFRDWVTALIRNIQ